MLAVKAVGELWWLFFANLGRKEIYESSRMCESLFGLKHTSLLFVASVSVSRRPTLRDTVGGMLAKCKEGIYKCFFLEIQVE